MTTEQIVKSLRACGRSCCDDCVCFKEKMLCKVKNLEAADLIEQQAAKIAELEAKAPRWIPVTERLPKKGEDGRRDSDWVHCKYQEADKDGRLVVLPCKVGDTLWVICRDNVPREMELEAPDVRIVCTDEDNLCMATCNRKPDGACAYRLRNDGTDIGKTVFLTREEAEAALKEAQNG